MLQRWLGRHSTNTEDLLSDALRAIGRHDVIAQCMTDRRETVDDSHRQEAINALIQRTSTSRHTHTHAHTHTLLRAGSAVGLAIYRSRF